MTLDAITSPLLRPFGHGFYTRKGGASSGIFEGLNCGPGSSDLADCVRLNRTRVAEDLGVTLDDLVSLDQVHSPDVVTLDAAPKGKPTADAMVSATPGLALGILTADCQPVLFADAEAGVVGAAHAGWKGARAGVLEATLEAMEAIGAKRENIRAVIGPSISQRAYEVGPEFFESFMDDDPESGRFFAGGEGDRMHFDLPSYGLYRLRSAGVGAAEWTGHCTYSDAAKFFSYRRSCHKDEADYGRLISVISA
ncbi:peptidoglycan editing factor PgeF [Rhodalgimonas zhirmunskyi]|uniref:Purine nucleoside phosphorylase n=1 Tax=Rhodalgimonas zhirmunskyi TaxID=2964767 RepID=A0AAJ1UFD5_9RHOB|nr:peptidoglycan editing factor PgeF [Rhodoalgimonas zhirmunskyi]MDQ2094907.1 peptidoglycan editing factor PgeF [Rhodoalgimonas zhirmunskyi]